MADRVYPSGSTLSSTRRELHNEERVRLRLCANDDVHGDELPFAVVISTITSPAHGSFWHPRGRWQSGIPLCQECSDRYQAGLPFGFYMVDAHLPKLCDHCGCVAPCTDCDEDADPES